MSEIVKRYKTDDITIVWKPAKCIHAGECVKALPNVYKPREKPWLTPENATKDELVAQIGKCPSGALSYELPNENK
ncbi:MAG: (4Fe-4S)-binding protein [Bacteroidia bacterium]|nr:(4Fe-4S)-binding protein [Bacteroidia bacterium]NNJ55535.1 (4Fe-4S)-binding protein [Bacteroidia bacterium]